MTHKFYRVEFEWSFFGVERVIVSTNDDTGIGKIVADIEKKRGEEHVTPQDISLVGYSNNMNNPKIHSTNPQEGLYPILLKTGAPYSKKITKVELVPPEKIVEMGLSI